MSIAWSERRFEQRQQREYDYTYDPILVQSAEWKHDARRECNRVASDFYVTLVEAVLYSAIVVGFVYGAWRAYKLAWPWIVVKVLWVWDAGPVYAMRWVIVTVAAMFIFCSIMSVWKWYQDRKRS